VTRFEEEVIRVISALQPGDVITYGEVAEEAGFPGAARAVGNVLSKSNGLPWWRVVGSGGYLKTGHVDRQAELLRSEGIRVTGSRVIPGNR
jgi:methylated-DNA-protein-cysteine methyltransferase-like protein